LPISLKIKKYPNTYFSLITLIPGVPFLSTGNYLFVSNCCLDVQSSDVDVGEAIIEVMTLAFNA